jgi:hypothetical protein
MLKTLSFAIISSLFLMSKAHAMYEKELLQLIEAHVTLARAPKAEEPDKGFVAFVTSLPDKVVEGAGDSVRFFGDTIRGGDGISNYIGNALRTVGEYGSSETPTLGRKLREFWIGTDIKQVGLEQIFTSTAFALCESKVFTEDLTAEDGVRVIRNAYQDFVTSWNQSAQTIHFRSKDEEFHTEWFLNGVIRKRAWGKKPWETTQDVLTTLSLYKIDLTKHPKTKDITEETVILDVAAKKGMNYEDRFFAVQNRRLEVLLEYIRIKYQFERSMFEFNE